MYQTYNAIRSWAKDVAATHQSPTLNLDRNDTFAFESVASPQESLISYPSRDSVSVSGGALGLVLKEEAGDLVASSFAMDGFTATPISSAENVDTAAHLEDINGPALLKLEPVTPNLGFSPIVPDTPPRQYVFVSRRGACEFDQQIGTKRKWSSFSSESVAPLDEEYQFQSSSSSDDYLPPRKRFKSIELSPRESSHFGDQSELGRSLVFSDLHFQQPQPPTNRSNLCLISTTYGHQISSRFRNKARKFKRLASSRRRAHLSRSASPQKAHASTCNQNDGFIGLGLSFAPIDEFTLPSPQSSLPSLQEVLDSSPTSFESLHLPPPQGSLPSFDTMFKTSAALVDEERPDVVSIHERHRVVDVFPIRL